MLIKLSGPLDLKATLDSGQAFRWTRNGDWYTGVIADSVVSLRHVGEALELTSEPAPSESMRSSVADYLGLGIDLEEIYRSFGKDGEVMRAISRYRGMRILRQDPWECLASFICSSNSNVPRIRANVEAIAALCGDPIDSGFFSFPTPDRLAMRGPEELRRAGLGYRAEYLHRAAAMVANGRIDPGSLRNVGYEEALTALMEVPGVGEKVANCVMLFSMDKPDAFPVDVWIARALEEAFPRELRAFRRRLGRRRRTPGRPRHGRRGRAIVSRNRLCEWGREHFGNHAGWANHYLFHDRRSVGRGSSGGG